jgi:hypothetical protein
LFRDAAGRFCFALRLWLAAHLSPITPPRPAHTDSPPPYRLASRIVPTRPPRPADLAAA